jgi:phosphatidylethanolamine-binding protein (PEBP) family uncharacterized protein
VPSAKAASVRVTLALAAATLVLGGCGGSEGSAFPNGTTVQAQTPAPAAGPSGASPAGGGSSMGQEAPSSAQDPGPSDPSAPNAKGSAAAQGGQKHGPRIAQPKGPPEQAPSPKQVANATVADMSLTSPALIASDGHLGRLAATYTCDGKGGWPALHWGGVPAGSRELALFVMNVQPIEERIFFDWALAGIDPGLSEISPSELPKGAISGTNGFGRRGYEICPSGPGETYMLALYALPRSLSPKPGFDPLAFRQEVLDASGDVGLLPGVYERA